MAGRLAADLARVALKAATTNGAKGKRRTRAMLTLSDCDGGVGEDHRLSEHALLERVGAAGRRAQQYTQLDELRVLLCVGLRGVDALGGSVFRKTDLTFFDTMRQIRPTLAWTSPVGDSHGAPLEAEAAPCEPAAR